MALTLGDNFSYQGAKPLDARFKYDTAAAMKAVADSTMYDGCIAYCAETDKTYQWKSGNTVDDTLGKWREFSSGSGGGGTSEPTIINKTLTAAGWSNKQQTINFNGYDVDLGGVMGVPHTATAAQKEAYSEAIVNVVSQSGTSFTFSCENVPEIDLPVTLYAGGGGSGSGGGGDISEHESATVADENGIHGFKVENDQLYYMSDGAWVEYIPQKIKRYYAEDMAVKLTAQDLYKICQYLGATNETYTHGHFYQALLDSPTGVIKVVWVDLNELNNQIPAGGTTGQALIKKSDADGDIEWGNVGSDFQIDEIPMRSAENDNKLYQYIGRSTEDYKYGCFYYAGYAVENGQVVRAWEDIPVQDLQKGTMPAASIANAGRIYQYVGETTEDYIQGEFYKNISNSWTQISGINVVPAGGTTGQALVKKSNADNDVEWKTIESGSNIEPSTTTPSMDGTAAVGSSDKYARADHVHPSDTSKQNKLTASNGINITNNTISTDNMPSTDMSQIVSPLPGVMSRKHKYSTEEQVIGEWINGKPIYQKTIDFGALPNATVKSINHGISNIGQVIDLRCIGYSSSWSYAIPYLNINQTSKSVTCYIESTTVSVQTTFDKSGESAYITVQYTKTTD